MATAREPRRLSFRQVARLAQAQPNPSWSQPHRLRDRPSRPVSHPLSSHSRVPSGSGSLARACHRVSAMRKCGPPPSHQHHLRPYDPTNQIVVSPSLHGNSRFASSRHIQTHRPREGREREKKLCDARHLLERERERARIYLFQHCNLIRTIIAIVIPTEIHINIFIN